jgi:hypothetical protein
MSHKSQGQEATAAEWMSEWVKVNEKKERWTISAQSYRSQLCIVSSRSPPVWCTQWELKSPPCPGAYADQMLIVVPIRILWRIDLLLWDDSVNNSRCYGGSTAYACALTSHNNRRGDAGLVFCRSAPRLYNLTDRAQLSEWVQCSWGLTCGVLNSEQRKRNNLHFYNLLPGNI